MNRLIPTFITGTLLAAGLAMADMPSLINYQGRLTDATDAPVTGTKNLAISIYDATTAGNLLYTEDIGAVTLDANGIYSFQFGGAGTSNTLVTETVATTDGSTTTFQKVLDNSPVVAGSVSVTDGTYTWDQSAGSSNEDDFGVAYSTSLRRVTVNYYNGAPTAGQAITATYRYGAPGIAGALSSGAEHWMEVSVDGAAQAARQRVLTVPFAMNARTAETATQAQSAASAQVAVTANTLQLQSRPWRPHPLIPRVLSSAPYGFVTLPHNFSNTADLRAFFSRNVTSIDFVRIIGVIPPFNTTYSRAGGIYIYIIKSTYDQSGNKSETIAWSFEKTTIGEVDETAQINLPLDANSNYSLKVQGGSEATLISDLQFIITE